MVFNNKILINFGWYYNSSYAQNQYATITFPKAYTAKTYKVVITALDYDTSDASTLDISSNAVYRVSVSQFKGRVYGHSSADDSNGFMYIAIGY